MSIPDKIWLSESFGVYTEPRANSVLYVRPEQNPQKAAGEVSNSTPLLCGKDYAYSTVAEYEEITGLEVNEAFRIGWDMARATNAQLRKL